ncbi:MAG: chorismate mutase [Dehalococcoidia bacterium]
MSDSPTNYILGIRGATTATENTSEAILNATEELLQSIVEVNQISLNEIAAVFLTATKDLNAAFPATAARVRLSWDNIALMDGPHMDVPGSQPRCIRALILVNSSKNHTNIENIYLHEARNLKRQAEDLTDKT